MSAASPTQDEPGAGRRKIAILGGGCGGMAAAWGLVNSKDAADLDITVYQLGWRLGGKGASGRNRAVGNRIEEHGLHIWGGMYENAFAMMRSVYGELGRPRGAPLSVWYDPSRPDDCAFLPHDNTTLAEFYNGTWVPWNLDLPRTGGLPGDGRLLPTLDEYLEIIVDVVDEVLFGEQPRWKKHAAPQGAMGSPSATRALLFGVKTFLSEGLRRVMSGLFRIMARGHLRRIHAGLRALPDDPAAHTDAHRRAVTRPLEHLERTFSRWFHRWLDHHPGVRRVYMILNLGVTLVRGVLGDRLLERGLDAVDDEEFRAWLQRHGASDLTVDGVLVRGWHAFFFAYVDGDATRPSLSAASGLRTLFRYCFTYRGAFFWKMQAGMGDTIFAPTYQVLKAKGVKFRFFSRVESLSLQKDGVATDLVQSIRVTRQVDLAPGVDEYDPLLTVEGVPAWPSEPDWKQLDPEQVRRIKEHHVDLESWWADWSGVGPPETLVRGKDFDLVVLAIPPAAARYLTEELAERQEKWQEMLDGLVSNQTVAAQIWLDRPLSALGWPHGSTVGTVYANPLNTWANMDQLLKRESWPPGPDRPASVVYFCGTMTDATHIPPFTDHWFPPQQHARAGDTAATWLSSSLGTLYPQACDPGTPQFDWDMLLPREGVDELRFRSQYWRLNIEPSERYVLSLPGSVRFRRRADESGFENLYLAGDWLRTGINAGCVEAAVMGGLQASQAIAGFPEVIVGDDL